MHGSRGTAPCVEQLISAVRAGSPEAREELLQVCNAYLARAARGKIDTKLQAKVRDSDLVQESLLDAYRNLHQFRGSTEAELFGWLSQIARNKGVNIGEYWDAGVRQCKREVSLEKLGPADARPGLLADPGPSPSSHAAALEQDQALHRALEQLPDDYRQVVLLRNWKRLSHAEIGLIMKRTHEAVRKLWGRAIAQLAQVLGDPK